MDAFKIKGGNRLLDYRIGKPLDLTRINEFLSKKYKNIKLRQGGRHILGTLENNYQSYFIKLATTVGIGERLKSEKLWCEQFNKWSMNDYYIVPNFYDDGYVDDLYYIVISNLTSGPEIASLNGEVNFIKQYMDQVISFSEYIQGLPLDIPVNDAVENPNHQKWFVEKTRSWLDAIPREIIEEFEIKKLFNIIEEGASSLDKKPRHGDFTPWHMMIYDEKAIALIDGEHAHSHGVEYYDVCYFIQRVHSILGKPEHARTLYDELLKRGYDKQKLKTVLASRAIGGFLDESFKTNGDYQSENDFKNWVLKL